jgi:enolase
MIKIEIPEFKVINAEHLVLDFNGTLAIDGHYVPDVIGTVTETLETIELAYKNSYNCFVSHRRSETVDSFISDLTVAVNAGHLKTDSGCSGERIEKFNQLIRIEHSLGSASKFAGKKAFKNA